MRALPSLILPLFFTAVSPASGLDKSIPLFPDPRSGLWEGVTSEGGSPRNLSLHLEIIQDSSGGNQPTEQLSGMFTITAEESCSFQQQGTVLNKRELVLDCLAQSQSEFVPDGRHLNLTFSNDGTSGIAIWQGGNRLLSVNLHRLPKQPTDSPVVGEWIARAPMETCVLHVYVRDQPHPTRDALDPSKLAASVDVFSSNGGTYGMEINGIADQPDKGAIVFSLQGEGTSTFTGHVDEAQQRIVGNWLGHSDCNVFARRRNID